MFEVDWAQLFTPQKSILEAVVRGSVIYLVLFVVMRFLPRRTIGSMSASDILVIVLISETVSNALQGGAESVTEGLVLAATVFAWAHFIDFLDYRFPDWHVASAKPIQVIRDGRIIFENLSRDQVTEEEVLSQLREHGIDSPRNVVSGHIEPDGHFSFIVRGGQARKPPAASKPA